MSEHILEVKNIYKKYARRVVVNDVSFSVKGGEIVGLLGPNGAGKTTCFYITCGLVRSNKGEIILNQKSIGHMPMHKRANLGLGYLPQEPSIFRKLSVEDNIMAVLEMNKSIPIKSRKERLEELLAEFKVGHVRHIQGITLSGGERRRVEIARSLAMDPKFILLDEPFAGIDPISVGDIQEIIYQLRDKGIGILITDHNYREMLDTCNHSYVLHDGKIIAEGDKDSILANDQVKKVYLGEALGG
ncbi:LPS export ABC transporter ATP-binding protein [Candidatus Thioglobus sp. NP1]|uniref:LPS export ABC transporter ATP-binding protein n=1 Tax=Candidatus Thioglobus sp. NP1 TaxID=2508687 RepID=UPI000DEDA0FA|nr:LPS export ABC transporter ATP-binding protein [Candidatus Thioglobus sp. NP1]AXE61564.1 LPS export ABC transporter ATP-binding protein [Candidatus Thioglobus sp. NP1]